MEEKLKSLRGFFLFLGIACAGLVGINIDLNVNQLISLIAFSFSILGTLLFWESRLSFAFFGTSLLLFTRVVSLEDFIRLSSMEIILFLLGMMIVVGYLKEMGVFNWLLQRALILRNITAKKFVIYLVFSSAILACIVDEVTSILIIMMIIFELCDYFEVNPIPFILISVLATNLGSAGTVIGNPIGLMIAAKAGLTFEDFIKYAFPLMFCSLFVLLAVVFIMFKKPLGELNEKIKEFGPNDFLVRLLSVPPDKNAKIGFAVCSATLLLIAFHHRLEVILGLTTNTILLIAPLFSSAVIMIWRRQKAREYIEKDVDLWTLLFFMFLFAQAGVLSELGIAENIAKKILILVSNSKALLLTTILFGSGIISSVLDNVVVVVGVIPIIQSLKAMLNSHNVLWWALLFGACFGGNITIIGSTANIIAIGVLEKQKKESISFLYWLKVGIIVGMLTMIFVWLALLFIPRYH